MNSFKELKRLKSKADRLNKQVDKVFSSLSNKCRHKEERYHGRDIWYKCTHKGFPLVGWTDMTPCGKEKCPRINKRT